jgi:D-erythronate 2-dehydrogenase
VGSVSIRVIVTGGAGFIGTLLARRLLGEPVAIGGAGPAAVDELVLADLVAPPSDVAADPRVHAVTGDLAAVTGELGQADAIFHLAGVVSGAPGCRRASAPLSRAGAAERDVLADDVVE